MVKKESLTKQAIEISFWYEISTITQRAGGLIFTIILARLLLPEGFGLYNLAISITVLFFILAQGGIDRALVRYTSEYSENKGKERLCFNYIFKIKIIALVIVLVILALVAYPLSSYILKKPFLFMPLLLAAVFSFIFSLEEFFTSYFFAVKKVKYVTVKEFIYQFLRISLIILIFLVIFNNPDVNQAFIVLILSSLITLIFVSYKTVLIRGGLFNKDYEKIKLSKNKKKKIVRFMIYITLISLSVIFLGNIDTIMLGFLIDDIAAIGFYKSAFLLAWSISGLIAFTALLAPFFVQLKGRKLERAFNKTFRYMMMFSIPAAFGLGILGNYFLVLIYGYEYLKATISLYFLAPLIVISIYIGLLTELFSAKERPKDTIPLIVLIIIINLILSFIFIKLLSTYSTILAITGAAIATLISWSIYAIRLAIVAREKLKVKTDIKLIAKPLFSALIMVAILMTLKQFFGDINLIKGILLVTSGFLVYLFTMLIIQGIRQDDYIIIEVIKNKIKNLNFFKF